MIVGWIGLGRMGGPMAFRLLAAGHELSVWARHQQSAEALLAAGARWAASPGDLAAESDAVVTMVGGPLDVAAVYDGEPGIIACARPGTLLIDCTTSSPQVARRLAADARERDLRMLDAPVSGGPTGAERGELSIMVGGAAVDLAHAQPLLAALGATIVHQGDAGAGQAAKLANQVLLASSMAGIVEAFEAVIRLGLSPDTAIRSLEAGIARSPLLAYVWPRLRDGDLAPGFRITHFVKDLELALDAVGQDGAQLVATEGVLARYRLLESDGFGEAGTQALLLATRGTAWPRDRTAGRATSG